VNKTIYYLHLPRIFTQNFIYDMRPAELENIEDVVLKVKQEPALMLYF